MRKQYRVKNSGFSIVEIVIVTMFFIVLSTIVIFNYGNFDDKERLRNVALDVALNIREMQVRALSARPSSISATNPELFRYSYGIYVNSNAHSDSYVTFVNYLDEVDPTSPIKFWFGTSTDTTADYSCAGGDECIREHTLPEGYNITDITVSSVTENDVSISFLRPNPSAIIRVADNGTESDNRDRVEITITSPQGLTETVVVTSAGQIYTQ